MYKGLVSIALSILILGGYQFAYSQTGENPVIDGFISREANKDGASEYREVRTVVHSDVNGDRKEDLVVLYTLEGLHHGSNDYAHYLAVFLSRGNSFRFATKRVVGGRCFNVSLKSVIQSKISFTTKKCTERDPVCCPSKDGKAIYVFRNGKLQEVR